MRIQSLLVANRGEITRRIFRTAREMGIRCVAVFVEADVGEPFVHEADEAMRLDGGYLDIDAVVRAARTAGADAVHPGYGFLSERAEFAQAVIDAGLTWVGPPPEVVAAMGDKLEAKRAAIDAGVPVLPSTEDPDEVSRVGFPLLVKAAAGGGGKGMRVVHTAGDFDEAVAGARREAGAAFGDDRLYFERFVTRSRHVEIQILADVHGSLVHLGERECSIQRRHQKIIEESPSPVVDADLREAMGQSALVLAKELGYQSAGTVEFLVDADTGEFYFLEVNTRLQVEHPVTEAVTGIDLVREQIRIAEGQPLGYGQDAVTFAGYAIEARLYAEDPAAGFLPAAGALAAFEPPSTPVVRWDSGVETGSVVGTAFDPMLAKVIAHGATRSEATAKLVAALRALHVAGVTTNRDFLVATLRRTEFAEGDTTTDFIERVGPHADSARQAGEIIQAATAAALWLQGDNRERAWILPTLPSGWRNGRLPDQLVRLAFGEEMLAVRYASQRDGSFRTDPGGRAVVHRWAPDRIDVEIDGRRSGHRISRIDDRVYVQTSDGTLDFGVVPRFTPPGTEAASGGLTAPMPGSVVEVRVEAGDAVSAGAVLIVLEAMKMEHRITAPADGVVSEVRVRKGEQVDNGALLLVFNVAEDVADAD